MINMIVMTVAVFVIVWIVIKLTNDMRDLKKISEELRMRKSALDFFLLEKDAMEETECEQENVE